MRVLAIQVMETPVVQEKLKDLGYTLIASERRSPEYLQEFVNREIGKWAMVVKGAGIAPQ